MRRDRTEAKRSAVVVRELVRIVRQSRTSPEKGQGSETGDCGGNRNYEDIMVD